MYDTRAGTYAQVYPYNVRIVRISEFEHIQIRHAYCARVLESYCFATAVDSLSFMTPKDTRPDVVE